jgi:molybdopterin converting factor subunit 1
VRIEVRLFAMQRSQTGRRSHVLELADGADVDAAWTALVAEFPVLAPARQSVRFAVNGRYVEHEAVLAAGDELAVIPPVAGGTDSPEAAAAAPGDPAAAPGDPAADPRGPRVRRLEVVDATLEDALIGRLRREVASPADGAVAVFVGQTRETPGTPAPGQEAVAERFTGQRVEGLSYEALEPMVIAILGEIADEVEARFGVRRLAIVHRIGDVAIGEVSVVIAAAAPHREAAFAACRYVIEELKARAPIWKAERFADGSVWLGQPARSGPRDPVP